MYFKRQTYNRFVWHANDIKYEQDFKINVKKTTVLSFRARIKLFKHVNINLQNDALNK